jgi:WD40 repeat protein
MMPIALGNVSNMVVSGDENGIISIWKDIDSIKENIGCNFNYHTSSVMRIELTPDDRRLISIGAADNSMC